MIQERNLSVAWGKAFLAVVHSNEIAPMVVTINCADKPGLLEPKEIPEIRFLLDEALTKACRKPTCHTVANTIFPSMWNCQADRQELYQRYLGILPQIRKHRSNRNGIYFERFIAFGTRKDPCDRFNQLEHIIQTWRHGNHRRTALQVAVFDPHQDHTNQRQRGFPCLQQVAFAGSDGTSLSVTGFYATQYIFEKAYGNYLGLWRLGQFMAHEMGLELRRVTCIASQAVRGTCGKKWLLPLAEKVSSVIENYNV